MLTESLVNVQHDKDALHAEWKGYHASLLNELEQNNMKIEKLEKKIKELQLEH